MIWSFYNVETGLFTGRTISGPDAQIVGPNTHDGEAAIPGQHSKHTRRVVDGKVVDYTPPRPDEHHELVNGRWKLSAQELTRRMGRSAAMGQIADLEARAHRPTQELLLNPDDATARARLADLRTQIAALRAQL